MLILTRGTMQTVNIRVRKADIKGEYVDIEVTPLRNKGTQTVLGFDAPLTVRVDRMEVHQRRLREALDSSA